MRESIRLLSFVVGVSLYAQTSSAPPAVDNFKGRPRAIILSDIGNEPDDQMSLVRLLLYSNEIDIVALVATTSTWQKNAVHPETMRALVDAYGQVRPRLLLHAPGWPPAEDLASRVFTGQTAYGMAATGAGRDSPGAQAIVRAATDQDPRPLWICIWGGASTLAQALIDLRAAFPPEQSARAIAKLRVYSISDQDDAGQWIRREFPSLYYIAQPSTQDGAEYYYATWTGISGDAYYRNGAGANTSTVTNEWLDSHIRSKGPLGKVYPRFLFIMEGDTPSFLGLIDNGLNAYRRPDWGGWGGRYIWRTPRGETHPFWTQGGDMFSRVTSQDTVRGSDGRDYVSDQATIWRWRDAFQNDFAARMEWTVSEPGNANHHPKPSVNGDSSKDPIWIDAEVGQTVTLDASQTTDPDGQNVHFSWFHYPEAGGAGMTLADVRIENADGAVARVIPRAVCRPVWLPNQRGCTGPGVAHIILAVTDEGSPKLTSYRRVIFTVRPVRTK